MSVQVRRSDSGRQDLFHLGLQLSIGIPLPDHHSSQKLRHRCGQGSSVQQRIPPYQYQVAADIQGGVAARQSNGMVKGTAVCHQCRRREDAVPVRLDNSVVHIGREAEIIGVHDKLTQS